MLQLKIRSKFFSGGILWQWIVSFLLVLIDQVIMGRLPMQPFHDMLHSVWAKPIHYNGHESNDNGCDDKDAFMEVGRCHCVLDGSLAILLLLLL